LNYLEGIKVYWLGNLWQQQKQREYSEQYFRQPGHTRESPHDFIMRRILYTRMLVRADVDLAEEVFHIMNNAPIAWRSHLVIENIPNTAALQLKVREVTDTLLHASVQTNSNVITKENLASTLQSLGLSAKPYRPYRRIPPAATANLTMVDTNETLSATIETDMTSSDEEEVPTREVNLSVREAFAIMKRDPPPSRRGPFPFPKNDHVTTSMGKRPAWPCKVSGSANHWDKECPMFDRYK
jgi:hypothetical protein